MTRWSRVLTVVLLAVVLAPAPTFAQDAPAKRVSLDLKAMTPTDALKVLADSIGLTVTVDPSLTTPVDLVVRSVKARTALDTICDSIDCNWELSGGVITVTPKRGALLYRGSFALSKNDARNKQQADRLRLAFHQPLPADMAFDNTPLAEVAARLSKATGMKISIEAKTGQGQTISADFGNRPLSWALGVLSEQLKGTLVCSISVPKADAGDAEQQISIQIRAKPRP